MKTSKSLNINISKLCYMIENTDFQYKIADRVKFTCALARV